MRVLSLFDGMSCGRLALKKLGVECEYYASEIDKHAIKAAKNAFPDTVHVGSVTDWREWVKTHKLQDVDLIIGGSPCTGFSLLGKQLNFEDPQSKLFFEFVDILNYVKKHNPNVKFMLENTNMKREYLDKISEYLGVNPVKINSDLVSAQNRVRYYWANFPITVPEDKGIVFGDIADPSYDPDTVLKDGFLRSHLRDRDNNPKRFYTYNKILEGTDKTKCLTARMYSNWRGNFVRLGPDIYRKLSVRECCRLQTVPDSYFTGSGVSTAQMYKMLGNGWTVDVIAHILKGIL